MKQFLIIFIAISIGSVASAPFDQANLIFFGSNVSDFKNLTISTNFNTIFNTNYFNATRPTVLFIHGYFGLLNQGSSKVFIDAYLNRTGYNVIFGDWSMYANNTDYLSQVGLLPNIAAAFVQLLNQVKAGGVDITKIHLFGHSMGAHLVGYIARQLKAQNTLMDWATGLDPAGPLFVPPTYITFFNILIVTSSGNMLAKGNAKFVDIIHTNAGLFGTIFATGDVDFWVNGGSKQTHCTNSISDILNSCCHVAPVYYIAESLKSLTPNFLALKCPTGTTNYTEAVCTGPATSNMGFYLSTSAVPGNYFLKTNAAVPYSK